MRWHIMVIVLVLAQVIPCGHEAKTQGATLPMYGIPQQAQALPGVAPLQRDDFLRIFMESRSAGPEAPLTLPPATTEKALRAFLSEGRLLDLAEGMHRILESQ